MNVTDPVSNNDGVTLTLITPCLNAVDTIGDTFRSVAALALELGRVGLTLEHVVVDGGSDDGTLQLIEAHQSEQCSCTLIQSVRGGPYPAMNVGIANASGLYSHILNADDMIWDVDAYVALLRESLEHKAHFALGSILYFRRPSQHISSFWIVDDIPSDHQTWKQQLRSGLHYPHPGFLCRTDLYRSMYFDVSYSYASDYKLMQALLLSAGPSIQICTSRSPIVAMAKGGRTGQWQSILKGQAEIRKINLELGIDAPAWRRYLSKAISRHIQPRLRYFRRANRLN